MFSIRRRRQWNGWRFTAPPIPAVRRRRVGRDCSFAVTFGSRSWARAQKKELSGSAKLSKQPFVLSMPNISLVYAHRPMRCGADCIIQG